MPSLPKNFRVTSPWQPEEGGTGACNLKHGGTFLDGACLPLEDGYFALSFALAPLCAGFKPLVILPRGAAKILVTLHSITACGIASVRQVGGRRAASV